MKISPLPVCFVVLCLTGFFYGAACAQGTSFSARNLNILLWQSETMQDAWLMEGAPTCAQVRGKAGLITEAASGLSEELAVMRAEYYRFAGSCGSGSCVCAYPARSC
ncbi:hypothetical protein [Oleidesulfovibrio sp.]|uniref:hypothetical protein n=1 Tax=Oleidesulfovibrio sp. TaxID=2909707 RepID=UPI003A893E18